MEGVGSGVVDRRLNRPSHRDARLAHLKPKVSVTNQALPVGFAYPRMNEQVSVAVNQVAVGVVEVHTV